MEHLCSKVPAAYHKRPVCVSRLKKTNPLSYYDCRRSLTVASYELSGLRRTIGLWEGSSGRVEQRVTVTSIKVIHVIMHPHVPLIVRVLHVVVLARRE